MRGSSVRTPPNLAACAFLAAVSSMTAGCGNSESLSESEVAANRQAVEAKVGKARNGVESRRLFRDAILNPDDEPAPSTKVERKSGLSRKK